MVDWDTIGEALAALQHGLRTWSATPGLDAQTVAAEVLGKPRPWLLAHPEVRLTVPELSALRHALQRCQAGEPVPYVLGSREFFGRAFYVTPATLIPRPETELLVEAALAFLGNNRQCLRAADVGTGSGCIAVTLAVEIPGLRVLATDLSLRVLRTARANARLHRVESQVSLVVSDLFDATMGEFELICANLPYIPTDTLRGLSVGRSEPSLALDGGRDGLALIRRLLLSLPSHLKRGGLALLEVNSEQAGVMAEQAEQALPGWNISCHKDLAGLDRLMAATRA